jgi:putative restriction endonuclease
MKQDEADEASGRHWWVNHPQTQRQEIEGSYLWSPRTSRSGAGNTSGDNMLRAVPGDIVFSCADDGIGAVGVVIERARPAPTPAELPARRRRRPEQGWLLPVRFRVLTLPLHLKGHMMRLGRLLPSRHSPLRPTGARSPGVYLAEIPCDMALALRELLDGQVQKITEVIAIETDDEPAESAVEEQIWLRTDMGTGEKRQLVSARAGRGIFRENVERIEKACRVTGVLDRRHLRARHIKLWKLASDFEKLDGFNGLLLSPHIDHLFNRGHISFADDGQLLLSTHLNPSVSMAWGLDKARRAQPFRAEQCAYLDFHRRQVFEKWGRGRRS